MKSEIIAIERSRKRPGLWNIWTQERIKSAFSLGHGNLNDFMEYARDNSKNAHFVTEKEKIAEFLENHSGEVFPA